MNLFFAIAAVLLLFVQAPIQAAPNGTKPQTNKTPAFARFDQRARAGEHLTVVFFGASLTWGANASDPQLFSYRAQMAKRLIAAYPKAHFTFRDAAIGGTGSQLGVFRLQRDVLRFHPDLVFLDFSANDDINSDTPETLASYESLVRRIIRDGNCPLVQMIFPFQWNVESGDLKAMKRRTAHIAIACHYNTQVGDAVELAIGRIKTRQTTTKTLWPLDGVHPGDKGYELFADAAWTAFQNGVSRRTVCRLPTAMLNAPTYIHNARVRISQLGALPTGWNTGIANRTSAFYDFLMSRWLDDVAVASPGAAKLRLRFQGEMLLLFGESTPKSGSYRVFIDGKLVEPTSGATYNAGTAAKSFGGNGHHAQLIATGLAPTVEHTLEIEPVLTSGEELRLESVCVAGSIAKVLRPE